MVRFSLILGFEIDGPSELASEGIITKVFTMPALPRLGEKLKIVGDEIEIQLICHNLESGVVEVNCDPPLITTVRAYLADKTSWKIIMYSEESEGDTTKFLQKVQEYD